MYEQFANAIHQKYPGLQIEGENFPPPSLQAAAAQLLGLAKIIFIVLIVANQNPFTWFNMNTPGLYSWAQENKVSLLTNK